MTNHWKRYLTFMISFVKNKEMTTIQQYWLNMSEFIDGRFQTTNKIACWLYTQKTKRLLYSPLYMRVKMLMWLASIAPKRRWSICCIMFLHKNESCYLDMAQTKGYTLLYIHSHEVYANAKGVRRHMRTESPASTCPEQHPGNECTKQRERSEE